MKKQRIFTYSTSPGSITVCRVQYVTILYITYTTSPDSTTVCRVQHVTILYITLLEDMFNFHVVLCKKVFYDVVLSGYSLDSPLCSWCCQAPAMILHSVLTGSLYVYYLIEPLFIQVILLGISFTIETCCNLYQYCAVPSGSTSRSLHGC